MNPIQEHLVGEINALKSLLCDTDYKALKFAEGEISVEEYAETKANRKAWRARINEIEAELETLPEETVEVSPPEFDED